MDRREKREQTVNAFMSRLASEEKSPATLEKYKRDVKAFLEFAGDGEITKETVIAYKKHLQENYAARSVNSMLGRISDSRFAGFLNGSVFLALFYPIPFLLSVFFSGTDFSSFVYNARVLLIAISLLGGILCYAQSQSGAIAFASGTVAIGNIILAAKNNDLTFYIFSNIAVFAVICIIAIKNAYNAGGPASARAGGVLPGECPLVKRRRSLPVLRSL